MALELDAPVALIWAMAENRTIGADNQLPWYLPSDLQRFKTLTKGKAVIMGRKTFESIGRPLPSRENIVVTKNLYFEADGVTVVNSIEDAILAAQHLSQKDQEIFVIGGSEIYKQALPFADKLYVTHVKAVIEGDAFFPEYDKNGWKKLPEVSVDLVRDSKDSHRYDFNVYVKIN